MFVMVSPVPTNRPSSALGTDTQPCLFPALSSCLEPTHTDAKDAEEKNGNSKPRSSHIHIFSTGATFRRLRPDHTP